MQTLTAALLMACAIQAQKYDATATHYSVEQGGMPICRVPETGYCGAPTDAAPFWEGDMCNCGPDDPQCTKSYCRGCCSESACVGNCPSCPMTMCGKRFKVRCNDDGRGYCRSQGACVVMTVTNACPSLNACNTCKENGQCGYPNKCKAGVSHVDLCDKTFDAIAYQNKQPGDGIRITVEPTNEPEGPCGGNNGFYPLDYDVYTDNFANFSRHYLQ